MQQPAHAVWQSLLDAMDATVTEYHPGVVRTPTEWDELIAGTAFFPGGSGLWRGRENGGPLPQFFPSAPVMFVGHNFDSARAFARSIVRRGEATCSFWTRLTAICDLADLDLHACFFTNALMGLQPEKAAGKMPSTPAYLAQCATFLRRQASISGAKLIVTLGEPAKLALMRSSIELPYVNLRHPSGLTYVRKERRKEWLQVEAELLGYALDRYWRSAPNLIPTRSFPAVCWLRRTPHG